MTKREVFNWIIDKLFKVPEGGCIPKYLLIIPWLFFPVKIFRQWCSYKIGDIKWDAYRDTYEINGQKISGIFLRNLTMNFPESAIFQIIKRNGRIILKRRYDKEDKK